MEAGSGNIMPLHPSSLTACEDMVSLGDMNNAALLHNLRLRYWEDDIFVRRSSLGLMPGALPLLPVARARPRPAVCASRRLTPPQPRLISRIHRRPAGRRTSARSSSLSIHTRRSRSSPRATWTSTTIRAPPM